MPSLDEIFYKEFKQMLSQRKAQSPMLDLYELSLPDEITKNKISLNEKVFINKITDDYYSKLNGTEAILLSRPSLNRRKFDYKGEFIKKDGKYVLEEVDVHTGCVAILSDIKLGVPLKYSSKEQFTYVDVVNKVNDDGSRVVKYIYILPKKYCYKLNQVALVISANKMRVYYSGISMAMQNGNIIYLYTIPYKPSKSEHSYRCICTKTSLDFSKELIALKIHWLNRGLLFYSALCSLSEGINGRDNVAYEQFPQVLDSYIRYNPNKSLDTNNEQEIIY